MPLAYALYLPLAYRMRGADDTVVMSDSATTTAAPAA
jgi:hypothetical protein